MNPFARSIAKDLTSLGPMYPCRDGTGMHWNTRTHWKSKDEFNLSVLVDARVPLATAADILGRTPTSIAWRGRDVGHSIPHEWASAIAPRRKKIARDHRSRLSYPFIIKKRDEHADLLAVNALVPYGIPGREDVCQEIMLAMWEGRITVDQLRSARSNVRAFVRSFQKSNFEASGYARSLDAIVPGTEDLRLIDTLSTEDSIWLR